MNYYSYFLYNNYPTDCLFISPILTALTYYKTSSNGFIVYNTDCLFENNELIYLF
jgi:hypothetical protein